MNSRKVSRKRLLGLALLAAMCATAVVVAAAANARSGGSRIAIGQYVQVASMSDVAQKHLASQRVTGALTFDGTAGGKTFMSGADVDANPCKVIGRNAEQADVVICSTPDNSVLSSERPALLVPAMYLPADAAGRPDSSRLRLLGLWGFVKDGLTVRLIDSDGTAEIVPVLHGIFGIDTPSANAVRIEVADEQGRVVQSMTLR